MAYRPDYDYNDGIKKIGKIQFSLQSPEEIVRSSPVEIKNQDTYAGNEPIHGGMFDPRMGLDNGRYCPLDHQDNKSCPGYFGHLPLAMPVYHMQFIKYILGTLKCVCFRCSALLMNKGTIEEEFLLREKGYRRFEYVRTVINKETSKNRICPVCDALQPSKISISKESYDKIRVDFNDKNKNSRALWRNTDHNLNSEQVLSIFKKISYEDCEYLGFSNKYSRPEWMICTVLPIAPPAVRPSVKQENNQRMEDDLTHKYIEIMRFNNHLKDRLLTNATGKTSEDWRALLQLHIATLVDNEMAGMTSTHRTGRAIKAIQTATEG